MEKIKNNFYYISETNIPSKSANSIHVAKMVDASGNFGYNSHLIVPFCDSRSKYKKFYNVRNKIRIISIFKKKTQLNFFIRLIFSFKILFFLRSKKNKNIISRSVIASLILSICNINNVLEIHHKLKGLTGLLFNIFKKINFNKYLKIILIHGNLKKILNLKDKNVLILDDAVSLEDFKLNKKIKKKKNSIIYIGSFFKGKGLETIYSIAKYMPDVAFDLYGDSNVINKSKFKIRNLNFLGHIKYNMIPKVLAKYDYAIMPYGGNISVRSSNLDVSKTMSPLKMFDYLASKKIIFASDLDVYKHILKNNYNSILIKNNSINNWVKTIKKTKNNKILKQKIKRNAFITAKKYTWNSRFKLIKNILF